jgi:hypothetical protein
LEIQPNSLKGHAVRRITVVVVLAVVVVIAGVVITTTQGHAAPATNWDPSAQAMPVGNLPGWHQIFADNFAGDSYPVGSITGCKPLRCQGAPSLPWGAVPDGRPDTSRHCEYYPSKTVSILAGVLNIHMFTNSAGVCMDASLYPMNYTPMTYGRYSVRFRSDDVPGYKGVFFLWPTDNTSGEVDFPEANLNNPFQANVHPVAGSHFDQFWFNSSATWTSWHTATLEWTPDRLTFTIDGAVVGTTTKDVPHTPMNLVLRAESDLLGSPKPPASAAGTMQIDWVTVYSYVPPAGGQPPSSPGYDLVGSDGGVFAFGGAFYGSLPGLGVDVDDITGIVATATDSGYYLVGSDGGVFAFNAHFVNSLPGIGVHVDDIVGIVPTRNDEGYFLVGRDGGVFSFNAPFENSLPGIGVHVDDIVGLAATPDDNGYWLVGSNGAVYAFGDAHYFGNAPAGAVAITATHDGGGYWAVGANGAVTAFGDAGDYGDLPGLGVGVDNIVGMVVSPDSKGYNLIGSDGGVFSFGDAANKGSLPGLGVSVDDVVGSVPT